jgi:hypothetical protein
LHWLPLSLDLVAWPSIMVHCIRFLVLWWYVVAPCVSSSPFSHGRFLCFPDFIAVVDSPPRSPYRSPPPLHRRLTLQFYCCHGPRLPCLCLILRFCSPGIVLVVLVWYGGIAIVVRVIVLLASMVLPRCCIARLVMVLDCAVLCSLCLSWLLCLSEKRDTERIRL